jgi:hypothetical protein
MVGIVAEAKVMDAVDEAVEPETATKVSAPIAKLTPILQMHAENTNMLRREETTATMSAFGSSPGSQAMSKSITSPTSVYRSGGE